MTRRYMLRDERTCHMVLKAVSMFDVSMMTVYSNTSRPTPRKMPLCVWAR